MRTVLVIIGAATPPGRLTRAAEMLAGMIGAGAPSDVRVDVLDLGRERLEMLDGRSSGAYDAVTRGAVDKVASAAAVIVASPIYRGTITGALKNLLDHLPAEALHGKPVGLVVVGASLHHYLGVESHLRDIMSWFGAIMLPTQVYLTSKDFDDNRELSPGAATSLQQLGSTALSMMESVADITFAPAPIALGSKA